MAAENNSEPSTSYFPDFTKLELVQDILDNNRFILKQIKANHDSQTPDGLAKNFALIQDVNANIDKVIQVYAQISNDYQAFMQQQQGDTGTGTGTGAANGPSSDDADQSGGDERNCP